MNIIDISMAIHEKMQVYKNNESNKPKFNNLNNYENSNFYESEISLNLHTGTHIDMPLHMLKDGHNSDNFDISKLFTKCTVLDLTNVDEEIREKDLMDKSIQEGDFLILKTQNSFSEEFNFKFVYLHKSGAEYLKSKRISGVGIDSLGIERSQPNHETHEILFKSNVIIIEGLRLKDVEAGQYIMHALPLKINGVEALPARVVLISE